jgi:hypothetical protein
VLSPVLSSNIRQPGQHDPIAVLLSDRFRLSGHGTGAFTCLNGVGSASPLLPPLGPAAAGTLLRARPSVPSVVTIR